MAEVLLFHHAQGLTSGVLDFADRLRAAGHTVHTPDLYHGRTFDDLDQGVAHADELGFETLVERGVAAADGHADALVYVGFSLGVVPAQRLAQTRPGARGAVLCHSCVPADAFGGWPSGPAAQIHGMDADPYFVGEGDIEAARSLAAAGDAVELFVYAGDGHLFADASLSSYDADAAALLTERVLDFVARC